MNKWEFSSLQSFHFFIFFLSFYSLWIVDSSRWTCVLFILEPEQPIDYNLAVPNNENMPYDSGPIEATKMVYKGFSSKLGITWSSIKYQPLWLLQRKEYMAF